MIEKNHKTKHVQVKWDKKIPPNYDRKHEEINCIIKNRCLETSDRKHAGKSTYWLVMLRSLGDCKKKSDEGFIINFEKSFHKYK